MKAPVLRGVLALTTSELRGRRGVSCSSSASLVSSVSTTGVVAVAVSGSSVVFEGGRYVDGAYLLAEFEVVFFRASMSFLASTEVIGSESLAVSANGIVGGELGTSSLSSGSGDGETALMMCCGDISAS